MYDTEIAGRHSGCEGDTELGVQSVGTPGGKEAVQTSEEVVMMMMTDEILGSEHPAARRQEGDERLAAERHKKMF